MYEVVYVFRRDGRYDVDVERQYALPVTEITVMTEQMRRQNVSIVANLTVHSIVLVPNEREMDAVDGRGG